MNPILSTISSLGCILIYPLELDMPRQLNVTWWFGGFACSFRRRSGAWIDTIGKIDTGITALLW